MLFYNFALIFVMQDQWRNIDDNASGHMKTDMGSGNDRDSAEHDLKNNQAWESYNEFTYQQYYFDVNWNSC